jgi:hypothetical protein
MFTFKTSAGEETGYGIGWDIVKTPSGKQIYAHGGGSSVERAISCIPTVASS